ncbi:MAG: alpha/beta hydrolase [Acidobacteria bacterium]|nr:alpha/beta hydrolase [Acidobacteriota bacterium]MCA1609697.1 alpha/beta hydrolase [Acidobacteriota bacterium]
MPAPQPSPRASRRLAAVRLGMRTLGALAPPLAARAAVALFRRPPGHRAWEGESAILNEGRSVSFSVRGAPVSAWTWGAGPSVLLVHGWGSRGGRLGSFVHPLVAAGFSVVAFDAPGHGATGGRLSSLPEFLFAIEAAHQIYGPFAGIIGHSLGGAAATLAVGRGVRAQRVVLLAPAADPAGYTRRFAEIIGIAPAVRERMEGRLVREFGLRWAEFDVLSAARRLAVPLLVFHDEADGEVPFREGAAIASAWPSGSIVPTRGLGHRRIVHDPAVVARAVEFLAARDSGAALAR